MLLKGTCSAAVAVGGPCSPLGPRWLPFCPPCCVLRIDLLLFLKLVSLFLFKNFAVPLPGTFFSQRFASPLTLLCQPLTQWHLLSLAVLFKVPSLASRTPFPLLNFCLWYFLPPNILHTLLNVSCFFPHTRF